jgi:hypothetical protein
MPEEFDHLNDSEKLKVENEFLKMKMMLESGAEFTSMSNEMEIPPELENQFLNYVAEFERQYQQQKTITVFDKIGRPTHFKPTAEIPDNEIENSWTELSVYLNKYSIHLDVCSPNIPVRELYRFTVEELFAHEMDDMDIPGMNTGFIYDEFHPDLVYDNTRSAKENCISPILKKEPLEWTHHFNTENLRLNQHSPLSIEAFKQLVNQFKLAYDEMELAELNEPKCEIDNKQCSVSGSYQLAATIGKDGVTLAGAWKVLLELDEKFGYWNITGVIIEGIDF